jgi:hypothetical protein
LNVLVAPYFGFVWCVSLSRCQLFDLDGKMVNFGDYSGIILALFASGNAALWPSKQAFTVQILQLLNARSVSSLEK